MALYLVQHGLSLGKDEDPAQGLSVASIAVTKRMMEVAKGYQVPGRTIQNSPKKRARHTAELMAAALNPRGGLQERAGLLPPD